MTDPRDDLPALDPSAAALLRAYCRERAMPPAARARVRDRLGRAAPTAVGEPAPDERPETCPQVHVLSDHRDARAGRAWAVGLALAAAVLLWFARPGADLAEQTGHSATMSPAHGAADSAAATASVSARPGDARESSKVTSAAVPAAPEPHEAPAATSAPFEATSAEPAPPAATSAPFEATPPEATPPAVRDSKPRRDDKLRPADDPGSNSHHNKPAPAGPEPGSKSRPADPEPGGLHPNEPRPDPEPGSSLRDEQELLARGWQALAAGDSGLAARDADEHARRFPAGVLTPERRALAAAAACRDVPAHGAELARAFLADYPRSPLARRVREACERAP